MPSDLTLVVLAAGMAQRFGGLKQLEPVGPAGECLFEYSAFDALRAGFTRIVFVIRSDSKGQFQKKIATRLARHIDVAYAFQKLDAKGMPSRTRPWGTGHALLAAREQVCGPFVAINADDYYGPSVYAHAAAFLGDRQSDACLTCGMIGYQLRDTLPNAGRVSRAICDCDGGGWVTHIEEIQEIEMFDGQVFRHDRTERELIRGDSLVSMNIWAFSSGVIELLRRRFEAFILRAGSDGESEFRLPTVLGEMMADREIRLRVLASGDSWFGMTYRVDAPNASRRIRELVERGTYPEDLWEHA